MQEDGSEEGEPGDDAHERTGDLPDVDSDEHDDRDGAPVGVDGNPSDREDPGSVQHDNVLAVTGAVV